MIKYYCDLCNKRVLSAKVFGVKDVTDEFIFLASPANANSPYKKACECKRHLCPECLEFLGLKPKVDCETDAHACKDKCTCKKDN